MFHKTVSFIHKLRVYFLAIIIIGFFVVAGLNPIDVGVFLGAKIGSAVGMSTSVAENPFSRLAFQLSEKEDRLNQKEKELNEREKSLDKHNKTEDQTLLFWLMAGGIMVLFILIILNYYLDWKRKRIKASNNLK
ncbi:hypothetical protein KAU09_01110 [Candidatus Parcubacteria bacterium]|nr:hypothetical protein [Candidatus Parcubacteria bacterium]